MHQNQNKIDTGGCVKAILTGPDIYYQHQNSESSDNIHQKNGKLYELHTTSILRGFFSVSLSQLS